MRGYLLLLASAIMLFASCEGPAGRDGIDGESANWRILNYTVNSNDWELVGNTDELNSYWQAELKISELSEYIYENGNVFCYMFQEDAYGNEVQTLLPFTVPKASSDGTQTELWTETYACDFTVGSMMIYVNYSDFYTNNRPPTCSFRVVLNW